jgi:poly(3-hydroxybutyrate) depolymerase
LEIAMKMNALILTGMVTLAAAVPGMASAAGEISLNYGDRVLYVHVPSRLPQEGSRSLVVVLHGGMGNAERIVSRRSEAGLNMDAIADKYGFIVAYLDGTPVARMFGADKKGWNAGECCGQSSANNIDDVGYISGAIQHLARRYGINLGQVYGMGHSNGAMMTLRLMCETNLYAAAVPISGALEIEAKTCPAARGKGILAIRGADDENVPMAGGKGKGLSGSNFRSQEYTRQVFAASGARYTQQLLPGAQHRFETIESAMEKAEGISVAEKAARFFGLNR